MQIQPFEIWTRRERLDKRESVWVHESVLLRLDEGLSEVYLRNRARGLYRSSLRKDRRNQNVLPDSGKSWRYARTDSGIYYDYDRIPDARRQLLPSKADLLAAAEKAEARDRIAPLRSLFKEALNAGYRSFKQHYTDYPEAKAIALSKAAAILSVVRAEWDRSGRPARGSQLFKDAARLTKEIGIQYFPGNDRVIKKKVVAPGRPHEVITLPREGNSNSLKYGSKEFMALLLMLRNDNKNYSNAHIARKLKRACLMADQKCPSQRWIEAELAKPFTKFLTSGRYGTGRYAHQFQGYAPVQGAAYAGDCWQMDGTKVNIINHADPEGKLKPLFIVVVFDIYSGDLLGYHFDTKESRWAYVNALNMACNHTGYLPYEVVVDRFPGHNTDEWARITRQMEGQGTKVTVTSAKTGKARVERMFQTLQSVFMMDTKYYYGEGVQSKRMNAHRSSDYLAKLRKEAKRDGWDFDQAWQEATQIVEAYRRTPYAEYSRRYKSIEESPRQLHDQSDKPNVAKIDAFQRIDIFCLEKTVTIRNGGVIKTEIQRIAYHYEVEEYETVSRHKKVRLAYDLEDLSHVHLFEDSDDINRAYLGAAKEQRAVLRYGPDAEAEEMGRAKAALRRFQNQRDEEFAKLTAPAQDSELDVLTPLYVTKETLATAEAQILIGSAETWTDKNQARIVQEGEEAPPEDYEERPKLDIKKYLRSQL